MAGLREWCRGMTANQVNFFMDGSLWLAALSFLFLCAVVVLLWRRKTAGRRICGTLMALSAGISWIFLSLVLIQSGKILWGYYAMYPLIPFLYTLFILGGAVIGLIRRK